MAKVVKNMVLKNCLFLGVDVGNGYTNARKVKFRSMVRHVTKSECELRMIAKAKKDCLEELKSTYCVERDGEYYIVGEGKDFTYEGRHFSDNYLLCLLTAVANVYHTQDYINLSVCVGLPVDMYLSKDDSLRREMIEYYTGKTFTITIDGREVTITLAKFSIYFEGAYPNLIGDNREVVVFDMGMGTTNMLKYKNGEVVDRNTEPFGMRQLCMLMAKKLNDEKTSRRVSWEDLDNNFGKTSITIGREGEVDISFLDEDITQYIRDNLLECVKERFAVNNAKAIYVIGGGGIATKTYWEEVVGKIGEVQDAQEVNSQIFDILAQHVLLEGE